MRTLPGMRDHDASKRNRKKWTPWRVALFVLLAVAWLVLLPIMVGEPMLLSFAGTIASAVPVALLVFGVSTIRWARGRIGASRRCRKCDYQQAPDVVPSERCPECGADWNKSGGTVRGDRRPHARAYAGAGIALITAGTLLFSSHFFFNFYLERWVVRLLPTDTLIAQVPHTRSFDIDEWAALNTRTLTTDQERALAAGLLDHSRENSYLGSAAGAWFSTMLASGRMPPDLKQRYYSEMLSVQIDAPAEAVTGETLAIRLRSSFRRNSGSPTPIDELVFFDGFYIDSAAEPLARAAEANYASLFAGPDFPHTEVQAGGAGPVKIRAVLWFAIGTGLRKSSQWTPGASPQLPPTGVDWFQRIEVERTLIVKPKPSAQK